MDEDQKKILEKRGKELSEKAKAEEKAEDKTTIEGLVNDVSKENVDNTSKYQSALDKIADQNPKVVENVMDELVILYADNVRNNGKKAERYATKVCDKLNGYLKTQYFGFQDATKDPGVRAIENIVKAYHGVDEKKFSKELEDEEKFSHDMHDNLKAQVRKVLGQRLNSDAVDSIRHDASIDPVGFRSYVKQLANKHDVGYKESDLQSLEGLFEIFLEAANEWLQEKMRKERKKKKQ